MSRSSLLSILRSLAASFDLSLQKVTRQADDTTIIIVNVRTVIKPLRGVIGTALTWSITWAVFGMILRAVLPFEGNALSRRPSVFQLSTQRTAMWGVLVEWLFPWGSTLVVA